MTEASARPFHTDTGPATGPDLFSGPRPLPLRSYSEVEVAETSPDTESITNHARRKSAYGASSRRHLNLRRPPHSRYDQLQLATQVDGEAHADGKALPAVLEQIENESAPSRQDSPTISTLTPPMTPRKSSVNNPRDDYQREVTMYDFTRIDYELDRARSVGRGLWSSVYFAQPVVKSPRQTRADDSTPPSTPQHGIAKSPCRLYAVKVPARPDAEGIFSQEARILTGLQRAQDASQYIVPFYGLDSRNPSLIFEGVIGGSLESLVSRLKVMTELERHLELRNLFVKLSHDMVCGLRFIHGAGVVHADIKPSNILLDISDDDGFQSPVIRARYIDFSASLMPGHGSAANAGGTWDFMAPEQLRIQKDLNTPTFASDIWSLGLTLLYILVGGSPYAAACGDNLFMLREAIKGGDPLGFARMDPVVQKRMSACQDFVDFCRLALQKDRSRRACAGTWQHWLETHHIED